MKVVDYLGGWLIEYRNKAKSGEIIVGGEIERSLDNLINDLENTDYIYDTSDSDLRIEYIETFCKHTKSPFHNKPFILELWEKALIEAFYSFKWSHSGFKRFRKLVLLIARKNGKSTLCAALALSEFEIGLGGTDIICSSNDDNQANIIFDEINNMRELVDVNGKRTHKNLKGIFHKKNKSSIKKLSDRTRNKEGRNIDFGILDESHEMKTNVIAKSIEQSQSTKDEPMFINITTEGFTNDGYLDKELIYAREVLNGEREDTSILVWLYTQDSELEVYQDEKSWSKSNPSLGTIKKYDYLRVALKKAKADKAEKIFTLAKDFNFKQNNSEAWLSTDEIENKETFNLEDFRGAIGLGGVDLAETTDLASVKILLMRKDDNKKYIHQHYFIPESKVEDGSNKDKKNYLEWAKQGYLTICPGSENDFSYVTHWFLNLMKQYDIRMYMIGYDQWHSKYWIKEMEDTGFDCLKIYQDFKGMSNAMKLVEADIKRKLIIYNDNPIDKWCLENTALTINQYGMVMPVKVNDKENRRIDGAVSLIICYATYLNVKTEFYHLQR